MSTGLGNVKAQKIVLSSYGSYLGVQKGCFVVRTNHDEEEKYPLFEREIGEVVLKTGNTVSTGALATMGFWGIDCMILTQRGFPVAMLKSLDDDSHVETRIRQYDALRDTPILIAKQFVLGRIKGQNQLLKKYGLKKHQPSAVEKITNLPEDNVASARRRLTGYEGKCSEAYFTQLLQLIPKCIRPKRRMKFKAYDGFNNLLNLAYELLKAKAHIAILNAKLEPHLGFLHSLQYGKPSLVCDFQELYRHLMEDFAIQHCQTLKKQDFILKTEDYSKSRKGKRQYLNDAKTRLFMKELNQYFQREVAIPRMKIGEKQEIETLIREEALLFAKYLREERKAWIPRTAIP